MSALTMEDFERLVKAAFAELDAYESGRPHEVDHDVLMHDITMGRPLHEMETAIRLYAWRYCALKRGALSANGAPNRHARRDAIIKALAEAARENGIASGWASTIAKQARISRVRVWNIVRPPVRDLRQFPNW